MNRLTLYTIATCLLAGQIGSGVQQTTHLQLPPNVERTLSSPEAYVPDLAGLTSSTSELRDTVDRFATDRQAILRFFTIPGSEERRGRLQAFYASWLRALPAIDFGKLSRDGQVDYVLLRNHLEYQTMLLGREARTAVEIAPLVPFAGLIVRLQEDRQKLRFLGADDAAIAMALVTQQVKQQRASVEAGLGSAGTARIAPMTAVRAAQQVDRLRGALDQWFTFYNGYDPAFTAKVPEGYRALNQALTDYSRRSRE